MRRESSTVVALVGCVSAGVLDALAESPNVAVVAAPAAGQIGETGQPRQSGTRNPRQSGAGQPGRSTALAPPSAPQSAPEGWEPGALAMHDAARRRATYVVVPADPLAGVAVAWRAMWDVAAGGPAAAAGFEESAADTLAAWRKKRFELPDYYLVIAPPEGTATGPDLYLGPIRAARPHRVAVAATVGPDDAASASGLASTLSLLDTLRSLPHGPWWPPLDELLDGARDFYAGGLAETQQAPV
jgi:hypothetical protein